MYLEVEDRSVVSCPDNLIMTPTGDLLMAEDNLRGAWMPHTSTYAS